MARITDKRKSEIMQELATAKPGSLLKISYTELQWIKNWKAPTPPVAPQTAPEMLHKAAAIMESRGKQYDQPEGERSMGKCVSAFNIITGKDLKESEGWLLLQILKDVRQWQNPTYHQDSADDCVAYAALKGEALEGEQ